MHQGFVAVFYCEAEHFTLETLCLNVPNVVRFNLANGQQWWHFVGCYISPDNASNIEDVIAAIISQPWENDLLVFGDFNTDLADPEGTTRAEEIAALLVIAEQEEECLDLEGVWMAA